MEKERLKDYVIDLNLKFIYSKSVSTQELSDSRAASYLEFASIKTSKVYFNDKFLNVPCSKSEIFISTDLELFEKQKLLNFIFGVMKLKTKEFDVNTTNEFKKEKEAENRIYKELLANLSANADEFLKKHFTDRLITIIKYVLANIDPNYSSTSFTVDELSDNVYKYLSSLHVYDDSPFLYPTYGSSEISQAICRLSCVFLSTFIINDSLSFYIKKNNINDLNGRYFMNIVDKSKITILI